jgi:16S rRNA (cytidine1402-2'-O)-methyltransferase
MSLQKKKLKKKKKSDLPKIDGEAPISGHLHKTGILYVVATPIGNLEDITLRAIRVLREADCIAAEDTRQTRKLLTHFDIRTKIISYYKHREAEKGQEIIRRLEQGESVALVSDAGTPCISDPGSLLVSTVLRLGYPVVPIPGASALAAAFSVSGTELPFSFYGFLSGRRLQRKKLLSALRDRYETLVFYESPHRLLAFLTDLQITLGNRNVTVARELTKMHEEILRGPVEEVFREFSRREKCLGEYVIIVHPQQEESNNPEQDDTEVLALLVQLKSGKLSMRDAVTTVSEQLRLPRSRVYQLGLRIWGKK